MLDIGAGQSPYREYFNRLDYLTQDIDQNKAGTIDYVGDMNQGLSGIEDNSLDYLLCTQVLEHLRDPHQAFKEFCRILRPGRKLFLTTNFLYHMHWVPSDYYRFTKFGLEHLGKANGIEVEHIKSHGGIFHVLSYVLTTMPVRVFFKRLGVLYYLYLILFSPLIVFLNLSVLVLDRFDTDRELTLNYEAIYRKIS